MIPDRSDFEQIATAIDIAVKPIAELTACKHGHHWPPDNPRESGRRSDGKPEVSGRCFEGETIT